MAVSKKASTERDPTSWGVMARYDDYKGDPVEVAPEVVETVLDLLEADAPGPPDAPVTVITKGEPVDLAGVVELITEDGGGEQLNGALPPDTPYGYHRLREADGTERAFIVSPGTCILPDAPRWGWAVQLYSAWSKTSWGVGDFGDLEKLARWAARDGGGFLLLNPLNQRAPVPDADASPYSPSTRCLLDPLYLSMSELGVDVPARPATAGPPERIDRAPIMERKLAALSALWDESAATRASTEIEDAVMNDLITYFVIAETHGPDWRTWPAELASPNASGVDAVKAAHTNEIGFRAWVEDILRQQLTRASHALDIVHDLPIGVDAAGADSWLWQGAFALDARIGAPPDEFNRAGQNWGLPPFDPWKLRAQRYEPFIRTIRAAMSRGGGLRIDHVMGLFRLWWVPEGADPTQGAYVRFRHEDLLNIVALESHRTNSYVIGEDLGTVETLVRDEMRARNMLSYRLMWFEDAEPEDYPELGLAAVTNHDLPTIAGAWSGADLDEQRSLGLDVDDDAADGLIERMSKVAGVTRDAPPKDAIAAAYAALARTPSLLKVATLEDALEVELRPNIPGTTSDVRGNWSGRLPVSLEDLDELELPHTIAGALNAD
ncbi:MAG TPA: 4-alpha-glucanotransferase [Actinomycetota bacterium]|nr:4-alpha-glucanotransferase [Actinomycetota bacterium]